MVNTLAKDVLGVVPGLMAVGLVGQTAGMAIKSFPKQKMSYKRPSMNPQPFKLGKYKGPSAKPLVRSAVTVLVGVPLIGATAGAINRL